MVAHLEGDAMKEIGELTHIARNDHADRAGPWLVALRADGDRSVMAGLGRRLEWLTVASW